MLKSGRAARFVRGAIGSVLQVVGHLRESKCQLDKQTAQTRTSCLESELRHGVRTDFLLLAEILAEPFVDEQVHFERAGRPVKALPGAFYGTFQLVVQAEICRKTNIRPKFNLLYYRYVYGRNQL